jgi:hypothetical protein
MIVLFYFDFYDFILLRYLIWFILKCDWEIRLILEFDFECFEERFVYFCDCYIWVAVTLFDEFIKLESGSNVVKE